MDVGARDALVSAPDADHRAGRGATGQPGRGAWGVVPQGGREEAAAARVPWPARAAPDQKTALEASRLVRCAQQGGLAALEDDADQALRPQAGRRSGAGRGGARGRGGMWRAHMHQREGTRGGRPSRRRRAELKPCMPLAEQRPLSSHGNASLTLASLVNATSGLYREASQPGSARSLPEHSAVTVTCSSVSTWTGSFFAWATCANDPH